MKQSGMGNTTNQLTVEEWVIQNVSIEELNLFKKGVGCKLHPKKSYQKRRLWMPACPLCFCCCVLKWAVSTASMLVLRHTLQTEGQKARSG